MKQSNRKSYRNNYRNNSRYVFSATLLPAAALSVGLTLSVPTAHATIALPDEVIVTARRTEEVIQNVPISMTVFTQDMLNERNVTNGSDLVAYTPSLSVNQRFGSDQASFAIRGFTQEFRTTASVAVYFADVVAPRGGGSITTGDGAGPGAFFDLQNVQVLKGPQGTLFGRNTTGGAIQLVPQEPTNKLEGYLEASAGNYNMRRTQGVINVPITDRVRARFGVDAQKRDGYIDNVSDVGPNHFNNVNYIGGRASLIVDATDSLQNYTIFSYTNSENNGTVQGLFACDPSAPLATLCEPTLASQKGDFYSVASGDMSDSVSKLKQWQVINTTTWNVNDDLTVKNVLSYAKLEQTMRSSVFGTNFLLPSALGFFNPALAGAHLSFYPAGQWPGIPTNSQTSFVEELQLSGSALASKLTWQGGLYFESSKPDGWSGTLGPDFLACAQPLGGEPAAWQCANPAGNGSVLSGLGKIEYTNTAVYAQTTYEISDEFRVTTGLRYTVDKTDGTNQQVSYSGFPAFAFGAPTATDCVITAALAPDCSQHLSQKSEAPTWLIDFDYLPTPDHMYYAKYARGYRQGALNMFGAEGLQTFNPEKVDAYEIGSKWSFHAALTGTLNIAAFYNELSDQQLQVGVSSSQNLASPTTAIVNAGASTIQGVEIESTLQLYEGLMFSLAYTYLDTRLDTISPVSLPAGGRYDTLIPAAVEGGRLTFSPRNTVMTALNYRLPLSASIGDVSVGASYTYIDEQLSTVGTYGLMPSRKLVNLNANWKGIAGSGFDAALFATNVTNQKYPVNVTGLYDSSGMDFRVTGEPKMVGARLKYNF